MLLKGKDGKYPEEVLRSLVRLSNNDDFKDVVDYLRESKTVCAHASCIQPDNDRSKKSAGGYIALLEIEQLIEKAEDLLEPLKK